MCDILSPRLPELGLPPMDTPIPRPDRPRLGQPLHSHVCYLVHRRRRCEPQERHQVAEPDLVPILHQQSSCASHLAESLLLYRMLTDRIQTVLFTVCALNELFFIALYLLSFSSPLLSPNLLQQVPAVAAGSEATPKLVQQVYSNPYSAAALELARANKMVRFPGAANRALNPSSLDVG